MTFDGFVALLARVTVEGDLSGEWSLKPNLEFPSSKNRRGRICAIVYYRQHSRHIIEHFHCVRKSARWPYKTFCRHKIKLLKLYWTYKDSGNTVVAFATKRHKKRIQIVLCGFPNTLRVVMLCDAEVWRQQLAALPSPCPAAQRPSAFNVWSKWQFDQCTVWCITLFYRAMSHGHDIVMATFANDWGNRVAMRPYERHQCTASSDSVV